MQTSSSVDASIDSGQPAKLYVKQAPAIITVGSIQATGLIRWIASISLTYREAAVSR